MVLPFKARLRRVKERPKPHSSSVASAKEEGFTSLSRHSPKGEGKTRRQPHFTQKPQAAAQSRPSPFWLTDGRWEQAPTNGLVKLHNTGKSGATNRIK